MSAARVIQGTPNDPTQDVAVETDRNVTLSNHHRAVHVTASGVTVTLPPSPHVDQKHRVIASSGSVAVNGGGHPILGLATVPAGSFLDLVFAIAGSWESNGAAAAALSDLAPPLIVDGASVVGVSLLGARGDHTHGHGELDGGENHALAAPVDDAASAGFMSGADKAKLDAIPPNPDRAVLFSDGGAGGSVGGASDVAVSADGNLCVGVSIGPIASAGQIRGASGGVDGFGFELRVRNGADDADLIPLAAYNQTLVGPTDVFTIGGYGGPSNAPGLRIDYIRGDSGAGGAYALVSTTPTPQGTQNGVALACWMKVSPFPGYNERRAWVDQRHTNRILTGFANSIVDPETYLAMGEAVDGWGYCEVIPQVGYLATANTAFAYSATGDRHYLREDGQYRSMFGDGTSMDFQFAADANDTLTFDESLYDMYFVIDGTITAKRKITSPKSASKTSRAYVKNLNTFDIDFAWVTGAAVTVTAGHWAIIGARGGAAYVFASGV